MSADLPSPSFSNIGVHDSVVQQTMNYNVAITKKIPRGRVATICVVILVLSVWTIFLIPNNDDLESEESTSQVEEDEQYSSLSTGPKHNCVISNLGTTYCWGYNDDGQLGTGWSENTWDPSFSLTPSLVAFASDEFAKEVFVGDDHSCAILENGQPLCWGANSRGQIGDYSTFDSFAPMTVGFDNLVNIRSIEFGFRHTCALSVDGSVYCWGSNERGQAGESGGSDLTYPTLVIDSTETSDQVMSLASSINSKFTCALTQSGKVYCWGANDKGQLGNGNYDGTHTPQLISSSDNFTFTDIQVNNEFACAGDGVSVICWGANENGQLGRDSPTTFSSEPMLVNFPNNNLIISFTLSWAHACAIDISKEVSCWGSNSWAELGDGGTVSSSTPVKPILPVNIHAEQVFTEGWRTCALMSDASLYCWGNNVAGQIGDGTTTDRFVPTRTAFPSGEIVTDISLSSDHSCAIVNSTSVWCWGVNGGILGNGGKADSSMPTQILPVSSNENMDSNIKDPGSSFPLAVPVGITVIGICAIIAIERGKDD